MDWKTLPEMNQLHIDEMREHAEHHRLIKAARAGSHKADSASRKLTRQQVMALLNWLKGPQETETPADHRHVTGEWSAVDMPC